jgi:hypothetical protein
MRVAQRSQRVNGTPDFASAPAFRPPCQVQRSRPGKVAAGLSYAGAERLPPH